MQPRHSPPTLAAFLRDSEHRIASSVVPPVHPVHPVFQGKYIASGGFGAAFAMTRNDMICRLEQDAVKLLTPAQQQVLTQLCAEWTRLEAYTQLPMIIKVFREEITQAAEQDKAATDKVAQAVPQGKAATDKVAQMLATAATAAEAMMRDEMGLVNTLRGLIAARDPLWQPNAHGSYDLPVRLMGDPYEHRHTVGLEMPFPEPVQDAFRAWFLAFIRAASPDPDAQTRLQESLDMDDQEFHHVRAGLFLAMASAGQSWQTLIRRATVAAWWPLRDALPLGLPAAQEAAARLHLPGPVVPAPKKVLQDRTEAPPAFWGLVSVADVVAWIACMMRLLDHLNTRLHVAHMDVHLGNVTARRQDHHWNVYLIDFGLMYDFEDKETPTSILEVYLAEPYLPFAPEHGICAPIHAKAKSPHNPDEYVYARYALLRNAHVTKWMATYRFVATAVEDFLTTFIDKEILTLYTMPMGVKFHHQRRHAQERHFLHHTPQRQARSPIITKLTAAQVAHLHRHVTATSQDMWSMGVVMWDVFWHDTIGVVAHHLQNYVRSPPPFMEQAFTKLWAGWKGIFEICLHPDPAQRHSWATVQRLWHQQTRHLLQALPPVTGAPLDDLAFPVSEPAAANGRGHLRRGLDHVLNAFGRARTFVWDHVAEAWSRLRNAGTPRRLALSKARASSKDRKTRKASSSKARKARKTPRVVSMSLHR